jgi:hypothetical protein
MNETIKEALPELDKASAREYTAEEIRAAQQNSTARMLVNFIIHHKTRRGKGRGWAQVKGTIGGVEGE